MARAWKGSDGKDSWPQNYGGSSYRGPETMRTALMRSDNTAAADALMRIVGVENSAEFLLRLGVSEEHINRTPFGLALGSSGISPVEMAVAFGVLGNGGVYQSPITFLGIADSNKNPIYDAHANQIRRQVFRPSTAWLTVGHRHRRQDQRPDRGGQNGHQLRPEGRVLCRAHRLVLRHGVDRA